MKFTAHQFLAARYVLNVNSYASAGAAESDEVDKKGYRELLYLFILGDFVSSGEVFFQCQESATTGTGYTDITGARAPASSTYAQGTDDDLLYVGRIELMKRLRFHIVEYDVDTAAVEMSIIAILLDAVELPASQTQTTVFSV